MSIAGSHVYLFDYFHNVYLALTGFGNKVAGIIARGTEKTKEDRGSKGKPSRPEKKPSKPMVKPTQKPKQTQVYIILLFSHNLSSRQQRVATTSYITMTLEIKASRPV